MARLVITGVDPSRIHEILSSLEHNASSVSYLPEKQAVVVIDPKQENIDSFLDGLNKVAPEVANKLAIEDSGMKAIEAYKTPSIVAKGWHAFKGLFGF